MAAQMIMMPCCPEDSSSKAPLRSIGRPRRSKIMNTRRVMFSDCATGVRLWWGVATSLQLGAGVNSLTTARAASQRSLHNEPIFRLLLKVAVNGVSQCEFRIFSRTLWVHRDDLQLLAMRASQQIISTFSLCTTGAAAERLW